MKTKSLLLLQWNIKITYSYLLKYNIFLSQTINNNETLLRRRSTNSRKFPARL